MPNNLKACTNCGCEYIGRKQSRFCSKRCSKLRPIPDRFWAKVDKTATCWLWTGARNKDGYGLLHLDLTSHLAHRIAYELHQGSAAGFEVCHVCDNPACVNPQHLFLGPHRVNMRDAANKGRICALVRRPTGPLTDARVRKIRQIAGTMSQQAIGDLFGITQSYVSQIIRRAARI